MLFRPTSGLLIEAESFGLIVEAPCRDTYARLLLPQHRLCPDQTSTVTHSYSSHSARPTGVRSTAATRRSPWVRKCLTVYACYQGVHHHDAIIRSKRVFRSLRVT